MSCQSPLCCCINYFMVYVLYGGTGDMPYVITEWYMLLYEFVFLNIATDHLLFVLHVCSFTMKCHDNYF